MHGRKGNRPAGWLLSRTDRRVFHYVSCRDHNDLYRIIDPQEQRTRIFHSPLRIGNGEVDGRSPVIRGYFYFSRYHDLVVDAMNVEHAVNPDGRFSLAGYRAFNPIGMKSNFWIAIAFQNFFVHLAVAHAAAALAAAGIDYDLARDLPRCRLELQGATLQLKRSANGVKNI